MKTTILQTVVAATIALASVFGIQHYFNVFNLPIAQHTAQASFGGFSPSGGGTYRLGQSIGTSDTTIKLSAFKEPVSNIPYTMSYLNSDIGYGTLSPQSTVSEFISFSGITQNTDGSATLTGVIRGLTRTPAGNFCTASTTLATSHAGQSIFILSNSPCFQAEYLPLRSVATSTAATVISSTTPWHYDFTPSAAQYTGTSLVAYSTLLATAIQGAGTSTENNMGIVQLATQAQSSTGQASSTVAGTIGSPLVVKNSSATSTPGNLCGAGCVATTGATGKLSQLFYDLTQAFNVSGIWTFANTLLVTAGNKIGIGTTTPYAALAVVSSTPSVFGTIYATSTAVGNATSTFDGNIAVGNNATTTNLYAGGAVFVGLVASSSAAVTGPTVNSNTATAVAFCPAGYSVLGGGFQASGVATVFLTQNYPSNTTSWTATVLCTSGGGCSANTITATAICARIK